MKTGENKHTIGDLKQMQSLPLSSKIRMTEYRVRQWYEEFDGNVYVSFSGGKDSTVLLHIARNLYPDIEAVFVNTGLEYPPVRSFALSQRNVTELRPTMNFRDVVIKYGYPVISKEVSRNVGDVQKLGKNCFAYRMFDNSIAGSIYDKTNYSFLIKAPFKISSKCCDVIKKKPLHKVSKEKKPITAQMAEEGRQRLSQWLQNGCNAFDLKSPISNPMSFWTENDVLEYIHNYIKPELDKAWKDSGYSSGSQRRKAQKFLKKRGYSHTGIALAYGDIIPDDSKQIVGQINLYDLTEDYRGCKFKTTGCKRTGCIFCLFGITQDLKRIIRLQKDEPKLADYVLRGGEFGEDGMWRPDKRGMGYWFVLDWLALYNIKVPYENAEGYREMYGSKRTEKLLRTENGVTKW